MDAPSPSAISHLPPPLVPPQQANPLPILTKTHIPPSEEEQPCTSQLNLSSLHRRLDKDAVSKQENGLWHGGVSGVFFEFLDVWIAADLGCGRGLEGEGRRVGVRWCVEIGKFWGF
jgi:hypothetical protein